MNKKVSRPKGKVDLVKTLTSLSVSVESSKSKEDRRVALAKYDVALASLKAEDPKNPMLKFFQDKQKEWKKKEEDKNNNKGAIITVVLILVVLALAFYASHKLGFLDDDPLGDYFKNLFK